MSHLPGSFHIQTRQGASFRRVFTYRINEVPVNLTNWTARMQVRTKVSAPAVTLEVTPFITLGGSAGTVDINIPANTLAAIPARSGERFYVYDLELVSPNASQIVSFLAGRFTVEPEVTR